MSLVRRFVKNTLSGLVSSVNLKIFFDIPLKNGRIDNENPIWMTDRSIHHELMGTFHSKEDRATVALSNYQFRGAGVYTFTHEIFHLLDGNTLTHIKYVDDFLAEYRAILAELVLYKELKKVPEMFESDWHEKIISTSLFSSEVTVDSDRVFKATLDLLYPLNPRYAISKVQPILSGRQDEAAQNTYSFILGALEVFAADSSASEQSAVIEFSENTSDLKRISKANREKREKIEAFFNLKENKDLLRLDKINVLRDSKFNLPNTGHGDGSPRTSGGP